MCMFQTKCFHWDFECKSVYAFFLAVCWDIKCDFFFKYAILNTKLYNIKKNLHWLDVFHPHNLCFILELVILFFAVNRIFCVNF